MTGCRMMESCGSVGQSMKNKTMVQSLEAFEKDLIMQNVRDDAGTHPDSPHALLNFTISNIVVVRDSFPAPIGE